MLSLCRLPYVSTTFPFLFFPRLRCKPWSIKTMLGGEHSQVNQRLQLLERKTSHPAGFPAGYEPRPHPLPVPFHKIGFEWGAPMTFEKGRNDVQLMLLTLGHLFNLCNTAIPALLHSGRHSPVKCMLLQLQWWEEEEYFIRLANRNYTLGAYLGWGSKAKHLLPPLQCESLVTRFWNQGHGAIWYIAI